MEIFSEPNINKNLSLALGYFDGVHLGHRAVIKSAVDYAHKQGGKSAVITFKDHPCCYFYNTAPKYILTRETRREKFAELGVDFLYELDFAKIAKLTAQEYLENILIKNFSPISISTGFNHNFGAGRSGNTDYLAKKSKEYNYIYFMVDETKTNGQTISSTAIRNFLSQGEIEQANKMLGYKFSIEGKVITGKQIGRTIGFRTANILYPQELIELPFGAYSTRVTVNTEQYKGVTNFGVRPTVSNTHQCSLETHIIGFDKDIYGQKIDVEFSKMLRKEKKFNSVDELKRQIKEDISSSI